MLIPEHINLYIAEHPEWQRKLLVKIRQLVHMVDENVEEKWRAHTPHFDHMELPLLSLGASKTSVSVIFDKGAQITTSRKRFEPVTDDRSSRTLKYRQGDVVQEAAFVELVKKAIHLNNKLVKANAKSEGTDPMDHAELDRVLRKDPNAWANWEAFSPSCRSEYAEWIADGKKEETRKRRIAQALEMIREGVAKDEVRHRMKGS